MSNEMGWACSTYGENIYIYTTLMKPERKRALARSKRRWENNITINLQQRAWERERDLS